MYRGVFLVWLSALMVLGSCAQKPGAALAKESNEDYHLMVAIDSFQRKDYENAAKYYDALFGETQNEDYLNSFYVCLYMWNKHALLQKRAQANIKAGKNVVLSKRFLALSFYRQKKFQDAIATAKDVLDLAPTKEVSDYAVIADSYMLLKDYKNAVIYYQSAYGVLPSDFLVDKIANLLFILDRKQEAVSYLERHLKLYGFSDYISKLLSDYYLKIGDVVGIISVYERIYENNKNKTIGSKIIDLYFLNKDYDGLATFLEKTSLNDKLLFEIYKLKKNPKKAASLALDIYKQTQDINYLAQNAMIEYEENKPSKALVAQTVQKLKTVIKKSSNPIYLNYLGYVLIEHEINVKEGISYIKKALAKDKDNYFYIDSLAWGEYKLGNIKQAFLLMKKIENSIKNDETITKHYVQINKMCEKTSCNK